MLLVIDPPIEAKIRQMCDRVRWHHPLFQERQIDQTRLQIAPPPIDDHHFSFVVLGDSGTGRYRGDSPQRRVAQLTLAHDATTQFILHTGDVVYLVGAQEQYFENFIQPYRDYLVGGNHPHQIAYDQMVFRKPFLPCLGNHDYYNVPLWLGLLSVASRPIQKLFRTYIDLDLGWHGSYTGDTYARAFMDYLRGLSDDQLSHHIEHHYTAQHGKHRCLQYLPGEFTRLPNRYYTFHYQGIDFIALDSNTLNAPLPIPNDPYGHQHRQRLSEQLTHLNRQKADLLSRDPRTQHPPTHQPEEADRIDDLIGKVEQIDEQIRDIEKQLQSDATIHPVDAEQLNWLHRQLIDSWLNPAAHGRILYFHHPPYVTEATKWNQSQTLAIRIRLRQVFAAVRQALGDRLHDRPVVDLVLNGHAHCLEYLRTPPSPLADANIHYWVCGGSGYSLRRQRPEGSDLTEVIEGREWLVAQSHLFIGRQGHGSHKRRPYSGLKIDVDTTRSGLDQAPRFRMQPLVTEKYQHHWSEPTYPAIELQ